MSNIAEHDISSLVSEVWDTMLGVDINETSTAHLRDTHSITGCIQITGTWYGAVLLECPEALARQLTSIMFAMDDEEPGDQDIQDAFGELTNMVGGNIKALMPEPCALSLPTVVRGVEHQMLVPGSQLVRQLSFACEGSTIDVRVLEQTPEK